MEAQSLRAPTPFPLSPLPLADDFAWVYDDPDLAPFLSGKSRRRPETPLTAFA